MVNAVHKFKDRDIWRALRAAKNAGFPAEKFSVDPASGVITVFRRDDPQPAAEPVVTNGHQTETEAT